MGSLDVQKASILLVEPDQILGQAAASFLRTSGYSARHAQNEREALELVNHCSFQLLVIDIPFPDDQGVESLNELRPSVSDLRPYTVATSIYPITRSTLRLNGIDAFLQKPYGMQNLLWTVQDGIALLRSRCEE